MFKFIVADSGNAPLVYIEYILKEKFHWTQSDLDRESAEDIKYYLKIMEYQEIRRKQDEQ